MRPVVLIATANDRSAGGTYLSGLALEMRGVREALERGHRAGHWEMDSRPGITLAELLSLVRDPGYAARIAIFHYAGHAGADALLLESDTQTTQTAHAGGLAALLGALPALRLVFLNGCETRGQVQALLDAGARAVIATDARIADAVATAFATDLYRALVDGRTIEAAFRYAEGAARARVGDVPRAAYRDLLPVEEVEPPAWPWTLHCSAEPARWTLADLLGDPAVALPSPRAHRLPDRPYRHLLPFTQAEAAVFFGRAHDLRKLLDVVLDRDGAPLVLLFGAAGAGKSSLLDAGLLARLGEDVTTRHARRDAAVGLRATLRHLLDLSADDLDPDELERAWSALERRGRPLVLLIDQVEEAFTRPVADPREELRGFGDDLRRLLCDARSDSPLRRVVLGFRKEWLAEVQAALQGVWYASQFLDRLDEAAVVEAIRGPADDARLARQYHLEIEDGLAQTIARDMLADPLAPVAPTLQVLLARMWDAAPVRDGVRRVFDHALYERLRRDGLLLGDFLDQQLAALERTDPDTVDSGLALDLLRAHTTAHGTAKGRTADELAAHYAEAGDALRPLVQRCLDLYLLTTTSTPDPHAQEEAPAPVTRLVHDTLAPLVRERFDRSDRRAQRARRLLELRTRDWRERGTPLPLDDLATIEAGLAAMRALKEDERRMLEQARDCRRIANVVRRAAAAPDPLRAATLLVTLRGALEPPGGAAVAAAVAAQAMPIIDVRPDSGGDFAEIRNAQLSRDGRYVLLPFERHASVIRADGGGEVARYAHTDRLNGAAFTADGTQVMTVQGECVYVWAHDNATPEPIRFHGEISIAVPDPCGRWIAVLGPGGLVQLRAPQASAAHILPHAWPVRMPPLFSPDGEWLMTVMSRAASVELGASLYEVDGDSPEYVCLWRVGDIPPEPAHMGDPEDVVWEDEARTRERVRRIPFRRVHFVTFTPDSARFLCMDEDGCTIRDLDGGNRVELPTPDGFLEARFSPDGRRIAVTGGGYDVTVHELGSSAQPVRLRHASFVKQITFSDDGSQIAVATDDGVRIWPGVRPEGMPFHVTDAGLDYLLPHLGASRACFSESGAIVMTVAQTVRIWENRPAAEPVRVQHALLRMPTLRAAFSADGTVVASANDGDVRAWAADGSGEVARLLLEGSGWLDFADDDRVVVVDGSGGLHIWPIDGSAEHAALELPARVTHLAAAPAAGRFLACAGEAVYVWQATDVQTPVVLRHPGLVRSAEFGPCGDRVITVMEEEVRIWRLDANAAPVTLACAAIEARLQGDRVLTVTADGRAWLWRADGSGERVPIAHDQRVHAADFSPDGTRIVTVADRIAHVWTGDGRSELLVLRSEAQLASATFAPDGRSILLVPAVSFGVARVQVWRADGSGDPVVLEHPQGITCARFSPDGTRVVTGSADACARVWRVEWNALLDHLARVAGEPGSDRAP